MDSVIADKYRIIREIGSGGMGMVFHATHTALDRDVAIKVLHSNLCKDVAFTQRFLREAQSMARLDHKNIIRIYDTFDYDTYHCISMEYFEGISLSQVIKQQQSLNLANIVDMILQTSVGLAYAHARGIIHRDIKPSNIMVNAQGLVKITDFGVAAAAGDSSLTLTGELVGSPRYMPPEQARSERTDNRSDLYSLGMVFYELVSNKSPFEGDSGVAIIGKLAYEKAELSLEFPAGIPSNIERIIRSLLSRDSNKRYPNALSLRKHLLDAASKLPDKLIKTGKAVIIPSVNKPLIKPGVKSAVGPAVKAATPSETPITPPLDPHITTAKPRNQITQMMMIVLVIALGVLGFVNQDKVIPPLMAFVDTGLNNSNLFNSNLFSSSPIKSDQLNAESEKTIISNELKNEVELLYYHLKNHKISSTQAQDKFSGLSLSGTSKTTFDDAVVSLINGSTEFTEAGGYITQQDYEKAKETLAISEAFFEEAEKQFLLAYELTAKESSQVVIENLIDEALFLKQEMYAKKEDAIQIQADKRNILEYKRGLFFQKKASDLFSESKSLLKERSLIKSRIAINKSIIAYGKAGDNYINAKLISQKLVIKGRVEGKLAELRRLQLEVTSAKIEAEHDGAVTAASTVYNKANSLYQELQLQETKIHTLVDTGRDKRAIGQLTNAIELANNTKLTYIKASQDSKIKQQH